MFYNPCSRIRGGIQGSLGLPNLLKVHRAPTTGDSAGGQPRKLRFGIAAQRTEQL